MRPLLPAITTLAMLLTGGCVEERIVGAKGLLVGLPGAETSLPTNRSARKPDILATPEGGIREEIDADTVILHAKSVQHLMSHIVHAIQHDEELLFVEQILSTATLEEFRLRRVEPALGFREMVRRQRDVFKLFNAMPFGEGTPGLRLELIGPNQFRLALPKSAYGDLNWVGIDAVFEDQNFKLRWFVNP
ncbi:MAG: hypothetical protein AB8F26_08945 [Phycisphaerales bacterium]